MSAWRSRGPLRLLVMPGLRGKLVLAFSLFVGGVAGFVYVHVPRTIEREAMRMFAARAEHLAETVAFGVSAALFFDDHEAVREVVTHGVPDPDVVRLAVTDGTGAVIASFSRDGSAVAPGAAAPHRNRHDVSRDVRYPTDVIGAVHVGLSLEAAHKTVDAVRAEIRTLVLIVFIVGLFAIWLITSIMLEPLKRVAAAAADVERGDLSRRAHTQSRDEVGSLGRTFDAMLDRLAAAHTELQDANRTLEQRVTARTAQLQAQMEETSRAEHKLRASEERFRAIFEHTAVGVAVFDRDGALMQSNPALRSMVGSASGPLRGRRLHDLLDLDDAALARIEPVLNGGGRAECEAPLRDGAQPGAWAHLSLSAVHSDDGGPELMIAVVEDITERRELEERLRHGQKMEAVGRLAGGVAHDFNNLLTTINGVTDLLLTELPAEAPIRPDLEEIHAAGERAAALTRQLLAFSRRQVLQPRLINPNDVVLDLSRMLRRLLGETIDLRLDLDAEPGCVRADPGQLGQVIMNLAVNGCDAMPAGGTLYVRTARLALDVRSAQRFGTSRTGPHMLLSVRDTGTGMDASVLARVFEPFFTTKEVGRGTGLGLPTVYGIVQQSGGGIHIESEPNRGTHVQIVLPISTGRATAEVRRPEVPASGSGTVLVVEDETGVRSLVCRVLRRAGYTVLESGDPTAALNLARAHHGAIDLVLSDVVMPGMAGPEFVRRLQLERPDVSVLFMSGYTESEVLRHGISSEATAFIEKPMAPAALAAKVRSLLDNRPAPVA